MPKPPRIPAPPPRSTQGNLTQEGVQQLLDDLWEKVQDVGMGVPVGTVSAYAGVVDESDETNLRSPPAGWLLCNGASVSRSRYPRLFEAIGTTYGSDDDATFKVPDLRGRVIVGVGQGTGLTDRALADTFGAETHTHALTGASVASHSHGVGTYSVASHTHNLSSNGWADLVFDSGGDIYYREIATSSWTATHKATVSSVASSSLSSSFGTELGGATDGATATVTGSSASASPGLSGSTDAGDSCQPSLALNYMVYAGPEVN